MRSTLWTGAVAAVAAVAIPLGFWGPGDRQAELPVETAAVAAVETETPRQISAIVIHQSATQPTGDAAETVTVEIAGETEELTLEDYLTGVLLGEMPASYPLEALKAQAVAARTYTLRRLEGGGTLCDDPNVCQAYVNPDDAEPEAVAIIRQAVRETDGQVLCYDGALISATYFACSGGKTESAQAVWGGEVPYLVSVDSPGEEESTSFASSVTMSKEDLFENLGISNCGVSEVMYTDGGGVDHMTIGGKTFSGTELREKLGLKSTCFTMEVTDNMVTFSVLGSGHRVGLSQNGARVMAENGSSYEEILKWYYTGVELVTR